VKTITKIYINFTKNVMRRMMWFLSHKTTLTKDAWPSKGQFLITDLILPTLISLEKGEENICGVFPKS